MIGFLYTIVTKYLFFEQRTHKFAFFLKNVFRKIYEKNDTL